MSDRVFNENADQCTATSKSTGERCRQPAVRGYKVCRLHGANPKNRGGNPRLRELNEKQAAGLKVTMMGNQLGRKHGLYSSKMTAEERELYDAVKAEFREHYDLDNAADDVLLGQLAFEIVIHGRSSAAWATGETKDAVDRHMASGRRVSDLLRQLGIRRDVRTDGGGSAQTPQEMMLAMLDRAKGLVDTGANAARACKPTNETEDGNDDD